MRRIQISPAPISRPLRQMSSPVALVALFFFSGSAIAQINATGCTHSSVYVWAYNSLNKNPCEVAAYLQSTCNGGSFTVDPLLSGESYLGPSLLDNSDLCKCNTVTYSLMSACGACQSAVWIDWPEWAYNYTKVLPPSAFPNTVPEGTSVPQWALLDVTREDFASWDPFKAEAIGDSPEIGPNALIGISSAFTTGPTAASSNPMVYPAITSVTSSSSSSFLPANTTMTPSTSSGGGPDMGAIVGGVLGGIAVIAVAVVGAVYRFRQRVKSSPAAFVVGDAPQPRNQARNPLSDDGTRVSFSTHEAPIPSTRDHSQNPNETTTFPKTQEAPYSLTISVQATFTPYNGAGNSLATMQISQSQVYHHGAPTV